MRIVDSKPTKLKYTADGFFTFHHANTFEVENCIVADLVSYKDGSIVKAVNLETLRRGGLSKNSSYSNYGSLWRFVLPIEIPSVSLQKPSDKSSITTKL